MQKKKLDLNPPKTVEQLKFESQWKAGGSQTESQPKPADVPQPPPKTNVSMPPVFFDNSEFQNNSFDDIQNFDPDERNFRSLDEGNFQPIDFALPTSTGMIPGLDFIPEEPVPEPKDLAIVDLEVEEKLVDPKENPPPMPKFHSAKNRRPIIEISKILDEPGRSHRPEKYAKLHNEFSSFLPSRHNFLYL